MSTTGTDVEHDRIHVGDERLGVMHSGSRYLLGFGRNYYGIWEQGAPDGPAQRFPASEKGRHEAWEAYVQLEPSAGEAHAADVATDESMDQGKHGWTRGRIITASVAAAVVILAIVLIQVNKSGKSGTSAGGPLGNTAHVDVSGGAIANEDLTQQSFKLTGFGSLYPNLDATWAGASVTMHMSISVPQLGSLTTSQVPARRVEFTILPSGSASGSPIASPSASASASGLQYLSINAECTLTFTTMQKDGVSGSLSCTGVQGLTTGSTPIDVKGTFSGKA